MAGSFRATLAADHEQAGEADRRRRRSLRRVELWVAVARAEHVVVQGILLCGDSASRLLYTARLSSVRRVGTRTAPVRESALRRQCVVVIPPGRRIENLQCGIGV